MRLLSIEHSTTAYWTGFAIHALSVAVLGWMLFQAPMTMAGGIVLSALIGVLSWTLIEYVLHRFVLHEMPLFKDWHAAHHARPGALICTPTLVSSILIGALVLLPALFLLSWWHAIALTFGVLLGYLIYAVVHHGIHHWQSDNTWLIRRKRWHALHHKMDAPRACYGVTSNFWDHVFRSDDARLKPGGVRHRTARWP